MVITPCRLQVKGQSTITARASLVSAGPTPTIGPPYLAVQRILQVGKHLAKLNPFCKRGGKEESGWESWVQNVKTIFGPQTGGVSG